jgi:hypothetical protein
LDTQDENVFSSFSTFLFALATHTVIPQVVVELIEPSTPRIAGVMGGVCVGRETPLFAPFIQNASFYQDRLGTNIGKTRKKEWRFLRLACSLPRSRTDGLPDVR